MAPMSEAFFFFAHPDLRSLPVVRAVPQGKKWEKLHDADA
jgi:hypothetical protein